MKTIQDNNENLMSAEAVGRGVVAPAQLVVAPRLPGEDAAEVVAAEGRLRRDLKKHGARV